SYGPLHSIFVIPGNETCCQVAPPSSDVAQSMSEHPSLFTNRPCWNALTIVLPNEKVSGSTSVACWLSVLVNGSVLILLSETCAEDESASATTNVRTRIRKLGYLEVLAGDKVFLQCVWD